MLSDKFDILQRIGVGATAEVFSAKSKLDSSVKALKVFTPFVLSEPDTVRRIQVEVESLRRLKHPNIVNFYGCHSAENEFAIELEFVQGSDLRQWKKEYSLALSEPLLWILCQIAKGIGCAHEHGILHRDLKPENVLVSHDGNVKLTDFGLARQLDSVTITKSGLMAGSIGYMAPELINGEAISAAADIYSFGAIAYELLAGSHPFAGSNPQAIIKNVLNGNQKALEEMSPTVPPSIAKLIDRCLCSVPADRPASIWHIEAELMAVIVATGMTKYCRQLAGKNSRALELPEAFLEKSNSLKKQRRLLEKNKAPMSERIRLASEWSALFPDSSEPLELLQRSSHKLNKKFYLIAGMVFLVCIFAAASFYERGHRAKAANPPSVVVAQAISLNGKLSNEKKNIAWLTVKTDPDVRLFVDNQEIPEGHRKKIQVAPGKRKIKLVKNGFLPIENSIVIPANQTAVVNAAGGP